MDSLDSNNVPAQPPPTKKPTRHVPSARSSAQRDDGTKAMAGNADPTMTDESTDPLMMMAAASGVATLVLASGLAYVMTRKSKE